MAKRKKPTSLPAPFLKEIKLQVIEKEKQSTFPFNLPFLKKGFKLSFNNPVTIIVGENGVGKSTVIEALAQGCGFNILGGNSNHLYGNEKNKKSLLAEKLLFSWLPRVNDGFFLRAESFFLFADYLEDLRKESGFAYSGYGGESLHEKSHGESFFSLFSNRFGSGSVIIMDEPESALSPMRQIEFLDFLSEMEKKNNQIIVVTHSPIIMSYKNADLIEIQDSNLHPVDYKDTKHYKVWSNFIMEGGA